MGLQHLELFLSEEFEAVPVEASRGERAGVQRKQQKPRRKGKQETTTLTARELLVALEKVLDQEIPMMEFDYLTLHCQCWQLLERISTEVGDLIKKVYGTDRQALTMRICPEECSMPSPLCWEDDIKCLRARGRLASGDSSILPYNDWAPRTFRASAADSTKSSFDATDL